jgi:hypothetical protein
VISHEESSRRSVLVLSVAVEFFSQYMGMTQFDPLMSSPPQDNQEFLNKGKIGQDNYEHFIVMSAACVF